MLKRIAVWLILFGGLHTSHKIEAQNSGDFRIGGYMQFMPLHLNADLPEPLGKQNYWEFRMQQRLNLQWQLTESFSVTAQSRTRFFTGDLVRSFPSYSASVDTDDGYLNLSTMLYESRTTLVHFNADRLFTEWRNDTWNVRVGRQRINWGINMITNPNDLFNIYSFFEFDYPERPGSDAIRIQYHADWATRAELAFAPNENRKRSVAAFLYGFNYEGYDVQIITGYFRNQLAIGGGWAGNMISAGLKGEAMLFYDLEEIEHKESNKFNIVLAASVDYMFDNALFLVIEALYNQKGGGRSSIISADGFSASNPSYSRWQLTSQLSYPISPVLDILMAGVWFADENVFFMSPTLSRSVTQNTDLRLTGQFFIGNDDSPLSAFGNLLALSVRWNF
jgi:hypothetical protein